eukprot:Rmarinus@m.15953
MSTAPELPTIAEQEKLRDLWARAISYFPLPGEGNVYVQGRPYASAENIFGDGSLPQSLRSGVWFSITGYNPMGRLRALEENVAANHHLHEDLQSLSPLQILHTFSQDADENSEWREEGFTAQFPSPIPEDKEEKMLALGAKYGQAALYRYETVSSTTDGTTDKGSTSDTVEQRVVPCFDGLATLASAVEVVRVKAAT